MKKSEQFLKIVYRSLKKRSDSYLELGLSLASSCQIDSVVKLSESLLYRRKFSSIYETLSEVKWDVASLLRAELELFQERCETLAGYEVYSGDSTFIKRNEAKTLVARVMKRFSNGELAFRGAKSRETACCWLLWGFSTSNGQESYSPCPICPFKPSA